MTAVRQAHPPPFALDLENLRNPNGDIKIQIRLYGILREKLPPEGRTELFLAAGSTIGDVIAHLAITGNVQTAVNGQIKPLDTILTDGDTVEIFRAAAGG